MSNTNEKYMIIEFKDGYLKTDAYGMDTSILSKLVGHALKLMSRDDKECATMANTVMNELIEKKQ